MVEVTYQCKLVGHYSSQSEAESIIAQALIRNGLSEEAADEAAMMDFDYEAVDVDFEPYLDYFLQDLAFKNRKR